MKNYKTSITRILNIIFLFFITTQLAYAQAMPDSIFYAIKKDNNVQLSKYINKNNLDSCYWQSYSALTFSLKNGAPKCVNFLLKKGASVNGGCNRKSPLYFICKYSDLKMFKRFLAKGAVLSTAKYNGQSLIDYAEKYENYEIVAYLKSIQNRSN